MNKFTAICIHFIFERFSKKQATFYEASKSKFSCFSNLLVLLISCYILNTNMCLYTLVAKLSSSLEKFWSVFYACNFL